MQRRLPPAASFQTCALTAEAPLQRRPSSGDALPNRMREPGGPFAKPFCSRDIAVNLETAHLSTFSFLSFYALVPALLF